MKVYQTDGFGYFVGEVVADEDTLVPGEFLIPGGCVTEPPPEAPEGKVAQLVSGVWAIIDGPTLPGAPPDVVASPPTKADLLDMAANLRWQKETGGITVGGMFVATDDRSKLLLQGARTAADADPDHVEGWKAASGAWVDLDATTIIALSNAVRAHVSACFALERDVSAQIEAETITTREQVEVAFRAG